MGFVRYDELHKNLKEVIELCLYHGDAMQKIESYVSVGRDAFLSTLHWQDAVIRQLEIIGEAVKNVSEPLREAHPEIPWRRISGLRDVLIHQYMGVDLPAVWRSTASRSGGRFRTD